MFLLDLPIRAAFGAFAIILQLAALRSKPVEAMQFEIVALHCRDIYGDLSVLPPFSLLVVRTLMFSAIINVVVVPILEVL